MLFIKKCKDYLQDSPSRLYIHQMPKFFSKQLSINMETKQFSGNGVVPPSNPIVYIGWSLFGNEEDGVYGDANWNPLEEKTWKRRIMWWLRNPLHNFTFYTLGNMHKDVTVYGWPTVDVFTPAGGFCFSLAKTDKMWYPFISYIGAFKFYIGWRMGNSFGIKLTANSKK